MEVFYLDVDECSVPRPALLDNGMMEEAFRKGRSLEMMTTNVRWVIELQVDIFRGKNGKMGAAEDLDLTSFGP
jgi:hypothetical protein